LWTGVSINQNGEGTMRVEVVIAIPMSDIAKERGKWRANFFRVDRHRRGDAYLAWSPTLKNPPDFHVPDAFGWLEME
jgi:alpha-galactosidase